MSNFSPIKLPKNNENELNYDTDDKSNCISNKILTSNEDYLINPSNAYENDRYNRKDNMIKDAPLTSKKIIIRIYSETNKNDMKEVIMDYKGFTYNSRYYKSKLSINSNTLNRMFFGKPMITKKHTSRKLKSSFYNAIFLKKKTSNYTVNGNGNSHSTNSNKAQLTSLDQYYKESEYEDDFKISLGSVVDSYSHDNKNKEGFIFSYNKTSGLFDVAVKNNSDDEFFFNIPYTFRQTNECFYINKSTPHQVIYVGYSTIDIQIESNNTIVSTNERQSQNIPKIKIKIETDYTDSSFHPNKELNIYNKSSNNNDNNNHYNHVLEFKSNMLVKVSIGKQNCNININDDTIDHKLGDFFYIKDKRSWKFSPYNEDSNNCINSKNNYWIKSSTGFSIDDRAILKIKNWVITVSPDM